MVVLRRLSNSCSPPSFRRSDALYSPMSMNSTQHRIAILRALANNAAASSGERAAALIALEIHAAKLIVVNVAPTPADPPRKGRPSSGYRPTGSEGQGTCDTVLFFADGVWTLTVRSLGISYSWPGRVDYHIDYEVFTAWDGPFRQHRSPGREKVSVSARLEISEAQLESDPHDQITLLRDLVMGGGTTDWSNPGHAGGYFSVVISKSSLVAMVSRAFCKQISSHDERGRSGLIIELELQGDELTSWSSAEQAEKYRPGNGVPELSRAPTPLPERFS